MAQKTENYKASWEKMAAFEKNGQTASARKEAMLVYRLAFADGNQPQQIKAAMYLLSYNNQIEETSLVNNIQYLDTLINTSNAPAKNVFQSMQAELFFEYLSQNRYRLYNQTSLSENNSKDFQTWNITALQQKIFTTYEASLKPETLLKKTTLQQYEAILQKGANSRKLRPTLYDLLAHRALGYYINEENNITQPAYRFIIEDEKAFAAIPEFINTSFKTKDSSSLHYHTLLLFQQLLKFHMADADPAALLDANLHRLDFVNRYAVFDEKEKKYTDALLQIEKNYPDQAATSQAMYLRAEMIQSKGLGADTQKDDKLKYRIRDAHSLCKEAIQKFPGSEGAAHSLNLLNQIEKPELNLQTEKVNIPGEAFRALVTYKNVPKIYLRLFSTNQKDADDFDNAQNDESWKKSTLQKAMKSWEVQLPDPGDFRQHAVEIKIDGLPSGMYVLMASLDEKFSLTQNLLTRQVIYVSRIAYLINDQQDLFILDRNDGTPLPKAKVKTWKENYNSQKRKTEFTPGNEFIADQNGYVKFESSNDFNTYRIEIIYEKEALLLNEREYHYGYNGFDEEKEKKTFFFTDRSIYRPGQTVYFKALYVTSNSSTKKTTVCPNHSSEIRLMDPNGQIVKRLQLATNNFGTIQGNFILPEGLLNGQFHLFDSASGSSAYIRVEEYKRPKFIAEIKKPEGLYRLNDSIKVTGNAKGYAGNAIQNANITYRVTRKVIYPLWWGWNGYSGKGFPGGRNQSGMEISNGTTVTDDKGVFTITFKAIPDETADKEGQPVFNYEVQVDVTDQNGETRSANTLIAVGYQALQLKINTATKTDLSRFNSIKVFSTNMDDQYQKAAVTVIIEQLQSPDRILRKRYWEVPDQFIMTKETFRSSFPDDVYADEDEVNNWSVKSQAYTSTDSTKADGIWNLTTQNFTAGWYKITAQATDQYGVAVKAVQYLQLTSSLEKQHTDAILFNTDKRKALPGDTVRYNLQTGFDKIWLIQNMMKTADEGKTSYGFLLSEKPQQNSWLVTENDRGGARLNYVFVKHNRVYSGDDLFEIPWTNKQLNISYQTFRDKILPGSTEKFIVQIKGENGEKQATEALLSMYDASLDQFTPHQWEDLSSLWPVNVGQWRWKNPGFTHIRSVDFDKTGKPISQSKFKRYDQLLVNGWNLSHDYYTPRHSKFPAYTKAAPPIEGALVGKVLGVQIENDENVELNEVEVTGLGKKRKVSKGSDSEKQNPDSENSKPPSLDNNVQIRKNFNETAFFFPQLRTDTAGNIAFSFTIPEALTTWKLMAFAHTEDLASGYQEKSLITQKPLMLQPNAPRFLREGDRMELSVNIINLENQEINGSVSLELFDATTNKPVDGWFKNMLPVQYFSTGPLQSMVLKFPIDIPFTFNSVLGYRFRAQSKDGQFSDGEEAALPVLSNRMLVTESMPLNMRKTNSKQFRFEKLLNSNNSGSLTQHALTVSYTSNPAWLAVQALPYLMEFPFECAEQLFNRYYANTLAALVAKNPRIEKIFKEWKTKDTAALMSNLEKNEELKSVLLQETPWVMEAKSEAAQKRNIALLFDLYKLGKEKQISLAKLKDMVTDNGGFSWFKGGRDDRFITQYILTGIGHLKKLNALSDADLAELQPLIQKALIYLDARILEEYQSIIQLKKEKNPDQLSYLAIQYGYMRSFFKESPQSNTTKTAVNYYREQSEKYWLKQSRYMQAMIALTFYRNGNEKQAQLIMRSLKENAIYDNEMGMYWKDYNQRGYFWHQAPVEAQALMIEAFSEIGQEDTVVDDLKTWLLKQKQTRQWSSTKATAEACYALLLKGSDWLSETAAVEIQAGNKIIKSTDETSEAGTGTFSKTFSGDQVQQGMGNINVKIIPAQNQNSSMSSWGAVYWQYFENLDKITAAETPLKLKKKIYREINSDKGPILEEVNSSTALRIGDKIKVRIELRCDRDMEYLHMKDMRAACMEPVNVLSGYKWQGGLGYYETTKDAGTHFFFSYLPKGVYVFEYPLFVTHSGDFSNGITSIQCMYAPEFISHSEGIRIVTEKAK